MRWFKTYEEDLHTVYVYLKLKSITIKIKKKDNKTDKDTKDEETEEWNNFEKRDNLLENMLVLLNNAASLGFGPNPNVFGSNQEQSSQIINETEFEKG